MKKGGAEITRDKKTNRAAKVFFAVYSLFFTIITAGVIFGNGQYGFNPVITGAAVFCGTAVLMLSYRMVSKNTEILAKRKKQIIALFLAALLIINIASGMVLRFEPVFDLGAIFTGASEWAVNGNFMSNMNPACDPDYFYYFPNNLGGMWFLSIPFKIASLFGITDFFAVAVVFNAILTVLTAFFITRICCKLFGPEGELMALVCVFLSLPFYFMAPVFYTDSLSMVFPVMALYFYLLWDESGNIIRKRTFYGLLVGLTCALGSLIKFTVAIALIAIVIYHICVKSLLQGLGLAAVCAVVFWAVIAVFNGFMYSAFLDKAKAEKLNTPFLHWVMMSLEGDGRYNPGDYEFTRSFDIVEERDREILDRIGERLSRKGPAGAALMVYNKSIVLFGDPTYSQSDFLDDNPVHKTWLHSFLLYDGEHYTLYKYICSGIFFAMLIFTAAAGFSGFVSTGRRFCALLPLLCIFGALLFFSGWEVSGRYITNFVPMIIIGAVSGIESSGTMLKNKVKLWRLF